MNPIPTSNNRTPTISWQAVQGAGKYEVYISTTRDHIRELHLIVGRHDAGNVATTREVLPGRQDLLRRASNEGFLSMGLGDYVRSLDWTGRQAKSDKRGSVSKTVPPILEHLNLSAALWLQVVEQFGKRRSANCITPASRFNATVPSAIPKSRVSRHIEKELLLALALKLLFQQMHDPIQLFSKESLSHVACVGCRISTSPTKLIQRQPKGFAQSRVYRTAVLIPDFQRKK